MRWGWTSAVALLVAVGSSSGCRLLDRSEGADDDGGSTGAVMDTDDADDEVVDGSTGEDDSTTCHTFACLEGVYEVNAHTQAQGDCTAPTSAITDDSDHLAVYGVTFAGLALRPGLGLCADPIACAALEGIDEINRMRGYNDWGWREGWSSWEETADGTCRATAVQAELTVPEDGTIHYVRRRYELRGGPLPCSANNPDIDLYSDPLCVEEEVVDAVWIRELD